MRTLIKFKLFVAEIQANNSKKYKQEVLKKFKDDEVIQKYLKIAFDPYQVYGISYKKLSTQIRSASNYIPKTNSVFELFDYLAVHNTGTFDDILECCNALEAVAAYDQESSFILTKLICKDLSLGVEAKTINSVIPGLIPTFSVMLAEKYFDKPERAEGKEFAITTKIDGGRIIALKENGQVSFYTRAGQKYEGLVELEKELLEKFPDGICLDGEITVVDYTEYASKEAYKRAMKITRKDGPKTGVKMLVFDCMTAADFRRQCCVLPWTERRAILENEFKFAAILGELQFFELLPILYCGTDTAKIMEFLECELARGQEGIMINICDAPYEFKRTNNLLKVKKMNTLDLEIIGFEEGSGRLSGTLGAILVRYKKGNVVKVGSGFSDSLRDEIWNDQNKWLGAIAEIQYFEETTNADGGISLRFPIYKDLRLDKLEADF
jgi:DNA ligase-1